MPAPDLQTFVAELEQRGWLRRIQAEVDPILEITEITDRVTKAGGPALLFENVKGARMPLLINTFGTQERMCLALGAMSFDEVAGRVQNLLKPEIPTTLMQKLKKLPELAQLGSLPPKIVKRGVCQEVVDTDDADLFSLPAIKCWPDDGGRYITLGGVFSKNPETGDRNIGMYRVQLFEPNWPRCTGICTTTGRGTSAATRSVVSACRWPSRLAGRRLCPMPRRARSRPVSTECLFAGFLQGRAIELVPCVTQPEIEVPATAEIVIEGYIDPTEELILEGPFGDHTGFYSLPDRYPRWWM